MLSGRTKDHSKRKADVIQGIKKLKLEDLKVMKRSPDLLNNVKISQGQLRLIIFTYTIHGHGGHFGQMT